MRTSKLAAAVTTTALALAPAVALAHGKGHLKEPSTHLQSPTTVQVKAYGRYCREESKQHVKGEKGTAFSRCVTALAKLAEQERTAGSHVTPEQAKKLAREDCRAESKKHAKGEKGTPFSRCIVAAAHLTKAEHQPKDIPAGS